MTGVGRDYFERASSILAAAARRNQPPSGRLKITATPEFGTTRADNWIAAYLGTWPKVTVEAVYTIRSVDIIQPGAPRPGRSLGASH